jgi:hypothetical protein
MTQDERLAGFAVEEERALLERPAFGPSGGAADADDVVQDVRPEVLERPPRHAAGLRGWLRVDAAPVARVSALQLVGIAAGHALVVVATAWLVLGRSARAAVPFARCPSPLVAAAPRTALPDPGRQSGTLVVHVLRASDRAPLAGEAVHLERLGVLGGRSEWRESDGEGTLTIEGLPAGFYRLQARRGAPAVAEVGEVKVEVDLALAGGVTVRGTTVDPRRRPVANAEVWLSLPDRPRDAWRAALSDRNGAFTLADADLRGWVSARADGRLFSGAMSVGSAFESDKGAAFHEIVLPESTGLVHATVVDAAGEPVSGARVVACPQRTRVPYHDGRGVARAEGPLDAVETDAQGRFDLPAPDRPLPFRITAAGKPAWLGLLPSGPEAVIRLAAPAAITGLVLGRDEKPASGARLVCAGSFPAEARRAVAGPDGRFRVEGLEAGKWRVSAAGTDPSASSTVLEVDVDAGETREIELTLDLEHTIRGGVVDPSNTPIVRGVVTLEPTWLAEARGTRELLDDPGPLRVLTDAQGLFAFQGLDPVSYRLRLEVPGEVNGVAWKVVDDVFPGSRPVGVKPLRLPGASLRGRLEPAPPGVELFLRGHELLQPLRAPIVKGAFAFEALAAGTYELMAQRPGNEPFLVRALTLVGGEKSDLGTFALPTPGGAVLRLRAPASAPLEDVRVTLQSPGGWRYATSQFPVEGISIDPRGEVRFVALAPGEHPLVLKVRGFADAFRTLSIRSDKQVVDGVDLIPGFQVLLRVSAERALAPDSELHFEIESRGNMSRFAARPGAPWDAAELLRYGLVLPAGEQRVRVESDCGLSASKAFDPARLAGEPVALRLE